MRVGVDPAHGGEDFPGVVSSSGVREADLNLLVGLALRDRLVGQVDLVLTRHEDCRLTRRERRELLATCDVALEIHHGGDGQAAPIEVWCHQSAPRPAYHLGRAIRDELGSALGLESNLRRVPPSNSEVLRHIRHALVVYPGVLHVEAGVQRCLEPTYPAEVAGAIAGAVLRFRPGARP